MRLPEREATPYLAMVLSTTAQVGLIVISKRAMATGMTNYTFVAYSNALAAAILLPVSLIVHRSSGRAPLNFSLVCGFFSLGVLGCLAQLTGYTGINYTSAAFASAMLNLIPGFTFILAIIFGMEKLACKSSSFLAKAIGTVVSIAGAFIVTLYKGPEISIFKSPSNFLNEYMQTPQLNLIIGGLFLAADCLASSGYIIIQGIFGSAFQVSVNVWCLRKKGPLFVAMFHPLSIVIAAALGFIFSGDIVYVGSLVGSTIIVIGFYSVMWGKSKEVKMIRDCIARNREAIGEKEEPLLPAKNEQTEV
ncbi:nodulin MtN21 /EamA-like transporter family protein [Striga asiatica]|uniref:WAT1-related protein n=1 Tax=Striga asiatica TaxID=4170 RepID=A0A5A7R1G8_STRAF|nr:nodulin MtN21 /EamA-like transporter family protein [Striga asiatica]